jgi:lysyl-tRNA synthetase class 2
MSDKNPASETTGDAKPKFEKKEKQEGPFIHPETGEEMTKNAYKKFLKKIESAAKKAKKDEEKAAKAAQKAKDQPVKKKIVEDEILDPNMYMENRKNWLQSERDAGRNPYPHKFERTHKLKDFIEEFTEKCPATEEAKG